MPTVRLILAYAGIVLLLLFTGAYIQQYGFVGKTNQTKCLIPINNK